MKAKRIIALSLITIMVCTMLAGCNKKSSTSSEKYIPPAPSATPTPTPYVMSDQEYATLKASYFAENTFYAVLRVDYYPEEFDNNSDIRVMEYIDLNPNDGTISPMGYIEPFMGYKKYSYYIVDSNDPSVCYPLTLISGDPFSGIDICSFRDELGTQYKAYASDFDLTYKASNLIMGETLNLEEEAPEDEPLFGDETGDETAEDAPQEDTAPANGEADGTEGGEEEGGDPEFPPEPPRTIFHSYASTYILTIYTNSLEENIKLYGDDIESWKSFLEYHKNNKTADFSS